MREKVKLTLLPLNQCHEVEKGSQLHDELFPSVWNSLVEGMPVAAAAVYGCEKEIYLSPHPKKICWMITK